MPGDVRSSPCDRAWESARLGAAGPYLQTAELVLDESGPREFASVAVGNAVLAGIAASDVICCVHLARHHRGEDHRQAADLLTQAVPDGPRLAQALVRLLGLKDTSHDDARLIDSRSARDAVARTGRLVSRAREEMER